MGNAGHNAGFRSGFIALIGRPNAGKSTLLNRLVGHKLAIVTPTPLTTRARLHGILTVPHAQLIFVDTPAIHAPRERLGAHMMEDARQAVDDVDVIVWVLDATLPAHPDDERVASVLRATRKPIVLVLNKMDRLGTGALPQVPDLAVARAPAGVIPISAATGMGLDRLIDAVTALLPEGPEYFPPEMMTDQSEQLLAREFIREQAMLLTREEVPHGIAVEIEEVAPREEGLIYIRAVILVERDAHRKIVVGRGGRMLKEIGRRARHQIELLIGTRVYLDLWVKVAKDWRTKDAVVRRLYPD